MTTAGQFRRSVQRFGDYANDLLRADMNTFDDALNVFLEFCERDEVFSSVHAQLKSVPGADFESWYQERLATGGSMAGSGQLRFPTDPEVRMALMYELLRRLRDDRISFHTFVINFFAIGSTKIDAYIRAFNDAITRPLVRELSYRLDDATEQLPKDSTASLPLTTIQIIHRATNVIQQSAVGSNISQTATNQISQELETLFAKLESTLRSLADSEARAREYTEVVASARENALSPTPKISVVKALLAALPPVDAVASIVASILGMLG